MSHFRPAAAAALLAAMVLPAQAVTVLFTQNWETPNGFVNDGGDVNIYRTVNQNYVNQPAGFTYWHHRDASRRRHPGLRCRLQGS